MAYYRSNNPEPKPYELVDLAVNARIERKMPTGHDQFKPGKLTGQLHLQVEALSPVHVASGLIERTRSRQHPLVKTLLRVGNTPVIPGSSVKGCVRSIVEAITASCVRITRARELPRQLRGCDKKENLCLACRIFGAQDFQGLLRFGDLRLRDDPIGALSVAEVPPFYRPRNREAVYYGEHRGRRIVRGRKFYLHGRRQARGNTPIEVCRTGSHFDGTIDFTNLNQAELGLLLVALGQSTQYPLYLKLGGAKPACYGSLSVNIKQLMIDDPKARYGSWDAPPATEENFATYLPAARDLLLKEPFMQLVETLRWPNDRTCPSGNY